MLEFSTKFWEILAKYLLICQQNIGIIVRRSPSILNEGCDDRTSEVLAEP